MLPQLARRLGLSLPAACSSAWLARPAAATALWPPAAPTALLGHTQGSSNIGQHQPMTSSSQPQNVEAQPASTAAAGAEQAAAQEGTTSEQPTPSTSGSNVSSGFRRVRTQMGPAHGTLPGIVHINNSFNNIVVALTDTSGNLKTLVSAGHVGFKNARKSLPAAAESAADELAKRAINLGFANVTVKMKGPGSNKQVAVQSLHAAGLRIKTLMEVTGIPYNGCRASKRRRV